MLGKKAGGGTGGITIDDVIDITGELANLDTTDKSNLVNAINELASGGGSSWDKNLAKMYYYQSTNSIVNTTYLNQNNSWFQKIIDDFFAGNNVNILIKDYNNDSLIFGLDNFSNQGLRARPWYLYGDDNSLYRATLLISFNSSTHAYTRHTLSWTKVATYATKQYVDDSIANAVGNINTVLATLTTPSNGGGV